MQIALAKHSGRESPPAGYNVLKQNLTSDLPADDKEKTKLPYQNLGICNVFHFRYLRNLIEMRWNCTYCEAKLISNERLLFCKEVCNMQDTEQFSSYQLVHVTPISSL